MTIYKQLETKNPLYIATLDNGVTVQVYGDYALGDDGKTYYHVGKEDENGLLVTVGWSCDVLGAVEV
ncbi:MAG: hypothetical protein ACI4SB_02120 [Acutalibacteraceae bacterium]